MSAPEQEALARLAGIALEAADQAGAQAAQVHLSRARFVEVSARDRTLEKSGAGSKQSLSLRLFVDGRFGVHSTNDLRPQALQEFVAKAVTLTRLLEPDPLRGLPDHARLAHPPAPELGIYDPALAASPAQAWRDRALALEELARVQGGKAGHLVSSAGSSLMESELRLLATSDGFLGTQAESSCVMSASIALLEPGTAAKRRMGYWLRAAHGEDGLGGKQEMEALVAEAVARATRHLGARPGASGPVAVAVENTAAGRLLGDLLGCLNGAGLHMKRSYLAGRQGSLIASPLLTVLDDPLLQGGFASRWFDGEGVAAQPMTLIEQGVLKSFYLDTYYARQLALPPTTGSSGNLLLKPSHPGGLDHIIAQMDRGLAVTGFLGGNFNSTTGDFSYGVQGLWIENGRVAYPVEGMNLSGNFEQFWPGLIRVGDDAFPYSKLRAPSLLFKEAQLGGVSLDATPRVR